MTLPVSKEVEAAKAAFRTQQDFTHEQLAARIGVPYPSPAYYSAVNRAQRAMVREKIVYEIRRRNLADDEPGGYFCCNDSEAITTNQKYARRIVKDSRRATRRLNHRVWGLTTLSPEDSIEATAQAIIYSEVTRLTKTAHLDSVRTSLQSSFAAGPHVDADDLFSVAARMFGPKR
ncbi:MAG: hypothetical protein EOP83_09190 [Verrucomicrobiaceae bacterium]|nr:MAG: hypothetical protein EOP83_09190 [Verrucomicrobiaceae bacterium]